VSDRGFALIEALVAAAVLALLATVALDLLDRTRRAFHLGENAVEVQQSVRAGWQRMAAELRAAGLASDPDGDPRRPDEPVELMLATAIVVRADLDGDDPAAAAVPERALAAGPFDTVTTGNDEIYGYALAGPGGVGPERFTFQADVAETVRDGDVETVEVADLALRQDAPPYTLYRLHLDPDPTTGPRVVRTPLIDGVRSLSFRYYDRSGARLPAVGGADDATSRSVRARIRRIEVELRGMARDPDPATGGRREFGLGGTVSPRNLGRGGRVSGR